MRSLVSVFRRGLGPDVDPAALRCRGWRQEADLNGKGSVWLLPAQEGREEADITLPLQRDLGDFTLRMGEVLRTLRQIEQRPEVEILQDPTCIQLMRDFIKAKPQLWNEDIGV